MKKRLQDKKLIYFSSFITGSSKKVQIGYKEVIVAFSHIN